MASLLKSVLILLFVVFALAEAAVPSRARRQTYNYPEDLKKYARPHSGTKIITGTVGRYAPQEWPTWYTRHIFKWNGESRQSPYHPNDVKYSSWQRVRFSS
uniref:Secreted protein n=1 Tax=Steinernema glaseri TaxID=37863 RepID=A0A1I7Z4Q6_9BILA